MCTCKCWHVTMLARWADKKTQLQETFVFVVNNYNRVELYSIRRPLIPTQFLCLETTFRVSTASHITVSSPKSGSTVFKRTSLLFNRMWNSHHKWGNCDLNSKFPIGFVCSFIFLSPFCICCIYMWLQYCSTLQAGSIHLLFMNVQFPPLVLQHKRISFLST